MACSWCVVPRCMYDSSAYSSSSPDYDSHVIFVVLC